MVAAPPPYHDIYPCIAFIARGALSKAWIHKVYRGANFKTGLPGNPGHLVVKYYYPYNPRTSFQQGWRGVFATGMANWQGFDYETKRYYTEKKWPRHMSGHNRYLRLYLNANYPPPTGNFLLLEDGGHLLFEDGGKITLEES